MSIETEQDDEITEGCGYEYDHTLREGDAECQECGAEIALDDEESR